MILVVGVGVVVVGNGEGDGGEGGGEVGGENGGGEGGEWRSKSGWPRQVPWLRILGCWLPCSLLEERRRTKIMKEREGVGPLYKGWKYDYYKCAIWLTKENLRPL